MVIMLASDLCRHILRRQPATLLSRLQGWSAEGHEVVVSAITYAELIAGVLLTEKQAAHMQLVEEFCDRLEDVVPWDRNAVDTYTAIQQQAMQAGQSLNMNDAMVAAHALSLGARLLVVNNRPFAGIAGLDLESWSDQGT
jgi:tRNA(fMet)-specific endonuclease VapC